MSEKLIHPFEPLIDAHSLVLILGSFPSIKSFELDFYYAHPRNQFWPIMGELFDADVTTVKSRKALAHSKHFALWDVYGSLIRKDGNSSDTNLSQLIPNDLTELLKKYPKIKHIFCTGKKSYDGVKKHFKAIDLPVTLLPSSSPAYAAMKYDEKLRHYKIIRDTLETTA
ncbi:MAG: DNA-deoxyinosine glycosylase [Epsilonproteobacteria bacterium]|nr:MAG: DNA-deoxyinosine glycosylase [Campylobacterota bacterium]